jgi:hypothetical protein
MGDECGDEGGAPGWAYFWPGVFTACPGIFVAQFCTLFFSFEKNDVY